MNKLIITIFKTIAIFIIASMFISLGVTTLTVFSTYSKMENVAYMMQSELSRNNRLLGSETGVASIDNYAKQLYDICATTGTNVSDAGSSTNRQVVELVSIRIIEQDDNKFVTYKYNTTSSKCDAETAGTGYILGADRSDAVGQYGDIKKIEIKYKTNFITVVRRGTDLSKEQLDTNGTEHTLTVYAPCLRYIKE